MVGVLIGKRLQEARRAAGMTQQALADVLQTHVMVISAWERNASAPKSDSLDALAGALGVSVDYLLGRTDDPARGMTEGQLSADELRVLYLFRQRDKPALLRVITDIPDDAEQQGITGVDKAAFDKDSGGGGE